jgi:hypothetical protein
MRIFATVVFGDKTPISPYKETAAKEVQILIA